LTNEWIHCGAHRSVKELAASITYWVGTWNDDPRPYVWHKTADVIFDSFAIFSISSACSPTPFVDLQG
jgi:hypothetical protein